jgi:parallel beta-helix repeat protein
MQGANNNIALQGGDCVNVGAGTYNTATTINLTKGGSANQANGYVTYIGAPNHGAVINFTAAFDPGLMINIPYVIIDGFDFNGNGVTTDKIITNIAVYHQYDTNYRGTTHHLMVLNNFIHDTQGAGVAFTMGDYYIYAGNTVWNTCTVNTWGESALYFFEAMNLPGFTPTLPWDTQYYHYQVLDNIVHDNAVAQTGSHSDGNGIDFDDFQYIQWRNYGNPATVPSAYTGHGLIAGNVVYHNGGAGILIAPSSGYADIYNNTVYNNGADPSGDHTEIGLSATNTNVVNNILLPPSGHTAFSVGTAWGLSDTGNTFTYNMTWDGNPAHNGVSVSGTTNDSGYYAQFTGSSSHNQLGVNPNLTNPPTDFRPLSGSPVLNAGAAFPAGILPGPANTTPDSYTFPSPPNIGAYNSAAAINTVAGPVSISAGGPAASPFVADAGFNGGTAASGYTGTIDTSLVATPAPQSIYQNQRYGSSFFYVVSGLTPGKTYQTVLSFTEDWDTAVGQRQINASINRTQVLSAFDIYAATGAQHKAIAKSFNAPADSNGKITVSFAGTAGLADPNAKIDGIQVLNVTAPPVAANESASTPYSTPVNVNLAAGATGNPASAAIVGTPAGGTVTLNGLTATFTPNAGFSGQASFQFTLSNAGGTSNTAMAIVAVGPPPASGQVEDFQYLAGDWYLPDLVLAATAGPSATGPNIIRCAPGGLRNKATIGNIGARVFTADPAGHLQFAIYTNGSNQRPANLVATSASMSAATAGVISSALSANVQGGPSGANFADTFWFCANSDSSVARFASINSVPSIEASIVGSASASNVLQGAGTGVAISHLSTAGTYGTWPVSLASATWTEQTSIAMPMMTVQFSSVP